MKYEEMAAATPQEEDQGADMKPEDVVRELGREEGGQKPSDPKVLAQALLGKAKVIRKQIEMERERATAVPEAAPEKPDVSPEERVQGGRDEYGEQYRDVLVIRIDEESEGVKVETTEAALAA